MNLREWALVAFTLLLESSAGILLVAGALLTYTARGSVHETWRALQVPLLAAVVAATLGLLASLAHLGHPLNAWLAVGNVRSSWLSREVVLAAMFTASTVAVGALSRSPAGHPSWRTGALLLAAVLGVATVYAMSRVYMVPAQSAWNRLMTPLSFFATTGVLGALVVGIAAGGLKPQGAWLAAAAIVLLVVEMGLLPAQVGALVRDPSPAISLASAGTASWLAAGKAVTAVAAVLLLTAALRVPGASAALGIAALVLVALSEILGRVLFYASSVRFGR